MNIPDDIFVRDYKGIGLAFATRRDCEIVRLDYLKDLNLPKYPLMFDEEKQDKSSYEDYAIGLKQAELAEFQAKGLKVEILEGL